MTTQNDLEKEIQGRVKECMRVVIELTRELNKKSPEGKTNALNYAKQIEKDGKALKDMINGLRY